jgi:tetratricopeptide (TPR) repeat protein
MLMKGHFLSAVCACVLVVNSSASPAQSPPDVSQKVAALEQQIQGFLQEQKPQSAIPLLRQIVALDPNNLNARANLGVLLYFQGAFGDAIPQMRSALDLQPDLSRIRALLGLAEKRVGDPAAAQSDLEKAFPNLNEEKITKQVGLELVELDSAFGQFAKALTVTERLQELLPQDPQILFVAYEISSQMTQQSLLNLVLIAPDSAELQMIIGGELGRQGEHEKAVAKYRDAIRLNPNLPGLHFELAEQLRSSPDPKLNAQAEVEFKAAVKANPYDEKSWCRLGESAIARGDFKAAQEDLKKALALQPQDSDAETDMAIALISLDQSDSAISLLQSALKDDPTNIIAHYRLSVQYRNAGRPADAQHEMDQYTHYKALKDKLGQVFQQIRTPASPM